VREGIARAHPSVGSEDRHSAGDRGAQRVERLGEPGAGYVVGEQVSVLVHPEDGHPVRRLLRGADVPLGAADLVGEGAAAGNHDHRPAGGQRHERLGDIIERARHAAERTADLQDERLAHVRSSHEPSRGER